MLHDAKQALVLTFQNKTFVRRKLTSETYLSDI